MSLHSYSKIMGYVVKHLSWTFPIIQMFWFQYDVIKVFTYCEVESARLIKLIVVLVVIYICITHILQVKIAMPQLQPKIDTQSIAWDEEQETFEEKRKKLWMKSYVFKEDKWQTTRKGMEIKDINNKGFIQKLWNS